MPSTEETSQEERNKILIRSFIEEIFNEHNLRPVDKYSAIIPLKVVLKQENVVKV
jgi:hypothetical protein